jgi:hypothetical protein
VVDAKAAAIHVRRLFKVTTRDRMVSTLHRIWPAATRPNKAPLAKACNAFTGASTYSSPQSTTTLPRVTDSPNSGERTFLIAINTGILMIEAVIRF